MLYIVNKIFKKISGRMVSISETPDDASIMSTEQHGNLNG